MPPARSRGAAGGPTQTSAALTSGRGCRPFASPLSRTGGCSAATRSRGARIPRARAAAKCAGLGGPSVPGERAPGGRAGAEVRPPRSAASCAATASSSPRRLRTAPRARRSAGRSCPSCSFSACQDCSTLSVLPRKRLSIHLEARAAPPRAGGVTAGAEEREERGSGAGPSAPPASQARSAQPSPAALLGTAVLLTSPPPPPRGGAAGRVGCRERGRGSVSRSVSACVCTRACASRGWGPVGTAAGSATSQKPSSLAKRRRGAAVNSRGRSLPGWGGDPGTLPTRVCKRPKETD